MVETNLFKSQHTEMGGGRSEGVKLCGGKIPETKN